MDRFYIFLILLINILKLFFVISFFKNLNKRNNNVAIELILFFSFINIILYGLVVNLFRLISNSRVLQEYQVLPSEVFKVEIIEFIASSIFLLLLFLYSKSKLYKLSKPISISLNKIFIVLTIVNILCIFNFFVSDYNNEFLFGEALKYLSGPSSIILIFYSLKFKKYNYTFFGIINLSLILFLVFSTGVRGPILGIFLIIIFILYKNYSLKKIIKYIPFLLIPILLIIFFNNQYSKIKFAFATEYASNPSAYQSITDIGLFIIDFYKNGNNLTIEGSDSKISEEIEFRLGARSMYSCGFFKIFRHQRFYFI